MTLQIKAFSNCDDAFIAWRSAAPLVDCIGFELWRIQNGNKTVVNNRVSFVSGTPDHSSRFSESSQRIVSFVVPQKFEV